MIVLVVVLLYLFDRMKRSNMQEQVRWRTCLIPLHEWSKNNNYASYQCIIRKMKHGRRYRIWFSSTDIEKTRNAIWNSGPSFALVNSITPFIDRMIHEVDTTA